MNKLDKRKIIKKILIEIFKGLIGTFVIIILLCIIGYIYALG